MAFESLPKITRPLMTWMTSIHIRSPEPKARGISIVPDLFEFFEMGYYALVSGAGPEITGAINVSKDASIGYGLTGIRIVHCASPKHQPMSRFTNCLAIDVTADGEKAGDLPALRKTPHTHAAGWGGAGTVQGPTGMRNGIESPMALKRSLPAASPPNTPYCIDDVEDFAQCRTA